MHVAVDQPVAVSMHRGVDGRSGRFLGLHAAPRVGPVRAVGACAMLVAWEPKRTGGVVDHPVGSVEELRRERCRVVQVDGQRIGVISAGTRFYAIRDRCPHRGADMCEGSVSGTLVASAPQDYVYGRHDQVIRCPWHGWEFDLVTGRSLLEPERVGLKVYPVTVDGDMVILHT
jgi:3-phenylpropionate/trans-cinnamate dioxygenase ferredoxin subunit